MGIEVLEGLEGLKEALRSAHNDSDERAFRGPVSVEAIQLRDICARYLEGNPFKPGDLIVPRKGFNIRGEGRPCVVLDLFDDVERKLTDDGGQIEWNDMRIGRFINGKLLTFLAESMAYEPYTGKVGPE